MNQKDLTKTCYNLTADEYAEAFFNELEGKPLDRLLLKRFASENKEKGIIVDLGCGPGQIARYMGERGLQVLGIDLSPRMVELAQRLNPGIHFEQGDMLSLKTEDNAWGGIAAFYSIIHIPRKKVLDVLRELCRVLKSGGYLLMSFHVGQEFIRVEELWGKEIVIDFCFYPVSEMEAYVRGAGF